MSEVDEEEYKEFLSSYDKRVVEYREYLAQQSGNKHSVLAEALAGRINEGLITKYCDKMIARKKDADFEFTVLIRLLYLLDRCPLDEAEKLRIQSQIAKAFATFSFWPRKDSTEDLSSQVFWSENHILMFLTGAHLFKLWHATHPDVLRGIVENITVTEFEETLLKIYLSAHIDFQGFHECNSHVYFPHTLSALLNIFDFSTDRSIVEMAEILIELLMKQVLHCTSDKGVASLSVSVRAFPRTRQGIYDHNINQLILLVTGHSPDPFSASAVSGSLATTKWQPSHACLKAFKHMNFYEFKSSPPKEFIRDIYRNHAEIFSQPHRVDDEDLIPFYWSAGLITDPNFAHDTRAFMSSRRLTTNLQLLPLSFLPTSFVDTVLSSYSHLSCGQSYCGVDVAVYKKPKGLVLSSLQMFNCSRAGFQQLPWILNLDGVAMWTQSGKGSESLSGFALTNTHNPYIKQHENVAVIAYSAPPITSSIFLGKFLNPKVRLFWPGEFCDEKTVLDPGNINFKEKEWWYARRNDCCVGVYCTAATKVESWPSRDAVVSTTSDESDEKCLPRRVCTETSHAWIVVVATITTTTTAASLSIGECSNFEAFKEACQQLNCEENLIRYSRFGSRIPQDGFYSVKVNAPWMSAPIHVECKPPLN